MAVDVSQFWRKVSFGSGCWEWQGLTNDAGYGRYGQQLAHRVAFELMRGPVPAGFVLMHKCDNRRCVRPGHLKPGTQAQNLVDMAKKGRAWWSEAAGH